MPYVTHNPEATPFSEMHQVSVALSLANRAYVARDRRHLAHYSSLTASMPRRDYDDLISLREIDSAYDLLAPVVYRPGRRCRDDRYYPYDFRQRHRRTDDGLPAVKKILEELIEPGLVRHGDLGWTLEYATAYCYKHLNSNRPAIAVTIDTARQAPLCKKAPFLIFDSFDRTMFQGKLKGMVYLKWRTLSDNSPGVTSAPDVRDPRICIELNIRPYEERDADLDDLLDALIHQMIHAYFLVCCGKQTRGTTQDGRLMDAVNFGVLMYTIKEISEDCQDGPLRLTFYSHKRARVTRRPASLSDRNAFDDYSGYSGRARQYIAIDPHGDTVGPPPNDGQSHCMHDNRRFRGAEIRNWQVSHYACAIELEMDEKGNTVYDLDVSGELLPVERLRGPPSSTYVELIWDEKRVMAPRDKVMEFDSLKKPASRNGKYELLLPQCDFHTLKCLWDFIQHRKYSPQYSYLDPATSQRRKDMKGPPIIVHGSGFDATDGVTVHIRVFKMAESMKFSELQKYAMERLYEMPTTSDDPITALKEIYNEKDKSKPIHAELHKWARKFLARTDEPHHLPIHNRPWNPLGFDSRYSSYNYPSYRGTSNYEKLISIHGDRFQELYHRNPAFKDDSKLVVAQLSYPGHLADDATFSVPTPLDSSIYAPPPPLSLARPAYIEPPLLRRRSFSDYYDPIDWRVDRARSPALPLTPPSYTHPALGTSHLRAALEDVRPSGSSFYDYFSRSSGRRRRVNLDTGNRYTRSRERWRDLYGLD
ncbi:hypothetical protein MBLNU13_g02684t2 [Cladosporium sp. NU13]